MAPLITGIALDRWGVLGHGGGADATNPRALSPSALAERSGRWSGVGFNAGSEEEDKDQARRHGLVLS